MTDITTTEVEARGLRFVVRSCGRGPLLLLQHGFPDLPESFDAQLVALSRAGYRAVAPTLRGYAHTCLPERLSEVHIGAVADDLAALVPALGASKAALIGHDWGAVATYLARARAPERFTCAVTCAIPNLAGLSRALTRVPRQLRRSWYQLFFALPRAPELWFAAGADRVVEWAYRTWSPGFVAPRAHLARVGERLAEPALQRAALTYYRALLRPGPAQREVLATLRRPAPVPTLCLYGAHDGCMDAALYPLAAPRSADQPFEMQRFEDAGHFVHLEAPQRFNETVLAWLARHHPPQAAA